MGNVIQFPSEKIKTELAFNKKFQDVSKNLPPQLTDCLKKAYEKVKLSYGHDLPMFELHISGNLNEIQSMQIQEAVEKLMIEYKKRILSMLEAILNLEAEICIITHKA